MKATQIIRKAAWTVLILFCLCIMAPVAHAQDDIKIKPDDYLKRPELIDALEYLRDAKREIETAPPVYEDYPPRILEMLDAAIAELIMAIEANRKIDKFWQEHPDQAPM